MNLKGVVASMFNTDEAEKKAAEIRAKVEKSSKLTADVVPNKQAVDTSTGIYLPDGSINPNAGVGG